MPYVSHAPIARVRMVCLQGLEVLDLGGGGSASVGYSQPYNIQFARVHVEDRMHSDDFTLQFSPQL